MRAGNNVAIGSNVLNYIQLKGQCNLS